jgi:hypothetical protein
MINKTFETMKTKDKNKNNIELKISKKTIVDKKKLQYKKNDSIFNIISNLWVFLWYDDSVWSWLANVVVAYLFIVFIFYPGVGLILNTSYPLVAVVSGSMEHMIISHDNNLNPHMCGKTFSSNKYFVSYEKFWDICGSWYENQNITKEEFSKFTFKNGFNKGDIVIIYGVNPKNLKIGDVIVFQTDVRTEPIIHRIVNIHIVNNELVFTTKGDHNGSFGNVDINIKSENILGKGVFRVPYLGWFKIWFTLLVSPGELV